MNIYSLIGHPWFRPLFYFLLNRLGEICKFLTNTQFFTPQDMNSCELFVDYSDVYRDQLFGLSFWLAPIHYRGSIGEQVMSWYIF